MSTVEKSMFPQVNAAEESTYKTVMFSPQVKPSLTVQYRDVTRHYTLTAPQVTIGRNNKNDIVIPIETVSRQHALLTLTPQGYMLTDQNSSNGLLHQGKRILSRQLANGDVIRIGDEMGNLATLTYHDLSRPAVSSVQQVRLSLDMPVITIGRTPDNVLRLNYPQVSGRHAVIRREGNQAMIEDLGSTNGTFIGGQRLQPRQPVAIPPGENIQVAGYQLVFQDNLIAETPGNTIRIDAVSLSKKVNKGNLVLLDNISLTIQPKEFVAIVGGSGAGKSTLMDALNGFRPASQGQILINGQDADENPGLLRNSLGYVPQDDIIHRNLTVEQALYYVAKLRLPKDTTDTEIEKRVAEVLEDVEMTGRRKVEVSRLSGGQRKRISIAVELLAKPNLFYLDEPTSGLDPGLDKRMMFLLRRLADQGRTIILVTHATSNITVCDKVVFMAPGGKLAFFGSPQDALNFFGVKEFADIYSTLEQNPESAARWAEKYRQSEYYRHYIGAPQANLAVNRSAPTAKGPAVVKPARAKKAASTQAKVSGWRQFWILTRRYIQLLRQDRINLLVLLLQAPIIGLVLALVAGDNIFQAGKAPIQTQRVLFILAIVAVWFGTSNAAREITKENAIYLRERLVNLKVMPYIMSKVAVLSVLSLIQSVTLIGIVMLRCGVPTTGAFLPAPLELIIGTWLTTMGGVGMGLLISALVSNTDKAGSIVPILLVPQIILAGLIFPLEGPSQYLSYVTISKWSIESLGTSANLNNLYYNTIQTAAAAAGVSVEQAAKTVTGPFDPNNYDNNPSITKDYSGNVQLDSRRDHLLGRWGGMVGMFLVLLALTTFFQKRKDRAWTKR